MQYGDQAEVVEFLTRSQYDKTNTEPRVIETHISIIVLRGDRAWKLKRALHLPYLDFSTAAMRATACEREVQLNRRTAPGIYLGTRRITRQADNTLAFDGDGALVDAVVEMRRFDDQGLFSRLAAEGGLTRNVLTALARNIAGFHQQAQIHPGVAGAGAIESVLELNEQNTDMAAVFGNDAVRALRSALRCGLQQHQTLLDARAAAGKIRHCHGDLHLRNICLIDGVPTLFDCIEFNESIAVIDVLYDLAFLLMDLWQAGLRADANWVMNRYLDACDEIDGLTLLPYFMALRASIRAQVLATQAQLPGISHRDQIVAEAQNYLDLAMSMLEPAAPILVAIGGLSGSGKSTVAAGIAHLIGAPPGARVLASDRIRKHLAGVPPESTLPPHTYTREASERVYRTLYQQAEAILANRASVVADAVFARPEERQRIEHCAARADVPFVGIWLQVQADTLITRVEARRDDPSDAGKDVVLEQLARYQPASDWANIEAGEAAEATLHKVLAVIESHPVPTIASASPPPWSEAPPGWDWLAQDADGRWYWYAVEPQLGFAGGVWRSPRRAQQFAAQGACNPRWHESCRKRPQGETT